jgi:DNA end-binding protein Ku
MKMARQLIDNLAGPWQPEKYTDEYQQNLMRIIQAKLKGKTPKLVGRETPHGADVVDLMSRLRASLEGTSGKPARSAGRARATAKGRATAKEKKSAARKGHAA